MSYAPTIKDRQSSSSTTGKKTHSYNKNETANKSSSSSNNSQRQPDTSHYQIPISSIQDISKSIKSSSTTYSTNNSNNNSLFQPKLRISQPGDVYEQEADRIAEKVMGMHSIPFSYSAVPAIGDRSDAKGKGIDKKCSSCEMKGKKEEEEKEELNISLKPSAASSSSVEANDQVTNEINTMLSGSSSSLDSNTKEFMESKFGYDLSNVRIHTDAVAAKSAESVNALAYTVGNDIVFREGQYSPHTRQGQRLLAHELTHVVQQTVNTNHKNQPIIQFERRGVAIPSPEEAAQQFLALKRLRKILTGHATSEGRIGLGLTSALREEMLALMSTKDIDRLDFSPSRSVDDIINQVRRLRISLSLGPETASEKILQERGGPKRTVVPPSSSILPEWLSLYNAGMVGFHVSIPRTPEPPIEARLTTVFSERGIPVDSRLLHDVMTNRNRGVQKLEELLRNRLPPGSRNQARSLAMWLAEKLQTASLAAVLKRERPTAIEETERKGELTSIAIEKRGDIVIGSLTDNIKEIPAGISITIRFR